VWVGVLSQRWSRSPAHGPSVVASGAEFALSGFPLVSVALLSPAGSGGRPRPLSLGGPRRGVLTSRLWRPWVSEHVLFPGCSGGLWLEGARGLWASGPGGVCLGHTEVACPFARGSLSAVLRGPRFLSQLLLMRCHGRGESSAVCLGSLLTVGQIRCSQSLLARTSEGLACVEMCSQLGAPDNEAVSGILIVECSFKTLRVVPF